jgi:competence protein ComEA
MDDILERWRIPIVGFLVLVIVAGLIVLIVRWPRQSSLDAGVAGSLPTPARSIQTDYPVITTPTARVPVLKVYVAGAVATPGVYTFHDGDRVEDAVKLAGGATVDADLSRINLAQRLRDEGQILVPRQSDTPVPGATGAMLPAAQNGKLNLNSASLAQLDALPGIGATYAQRIVDYRTKNGSFQKTTDLVDKKIVPQSTFDKIKDQIEAP